MEASGWTIAAVAIGILLLGVAVWYFARKRSGHAGHDAHAEQLRATRERDTHEGISREVAGLREQMGLLSERLDRQDRSLTSLRDEVVRGHQEYAARVEHLGAMETSSRELQEQIFELREEHKVLMQRDDRHERTVQELQTELSTVRAAVPTDGHRTIVQ